MTSPRTSVVQFLVVGCLLLSASYPGESHAAAGDPDPGFAAALVAQNPYGLAVQPNGKILLGGSYQGGFGGTTSIGTLVRYNADSSTDTTFSPTFDYTINNVAVQQDGKILVVGGFTMVNGTARNAIARLNADGTLDTAFNAGATGGISVTAIQADGKILVAGGLTAVNGTARNAIARLNADGTLDTAFNVNLSANTSVFNVAIQADGRIILGGTFGPVGGTTHDHIARINADGSVDNTFTASVGSIAPNSIVVQANGQILVGGYISKANGVTRGNLARLNADGTLDTAFYPNFSDPINAVMLQTDGKILVGSGAVTVNGTTRNYLTRLNADGSLDTAFVPNPNGVVTGIAIQNDGKLLLEGGFPSRRLVRLLNDGPFQQVTVAPSGASFTANWLRGGSLPEAQSATLEASYDNGNTWSIPVGGTRISGGWQFGNTALAASFTQLRFRARTVGGYDDGSSGLVEFIADYTTPAIAVEQPVGTAVADGGTVDLGEAPSGQSGGATKTFTIRNTGYSALNLGAITVDGSNPDSYVLNTSGTSTSLAVNASTTFNVTFAPTGTASAVRGAALHIASNVSGSANPYDVVLSGLGLSTTTSTGNDGLNDQAKYNLAALGFNWQVSQPALVNTYYNGANSAGLYTASQVQALNVGTPLLQRDASTGQFMLTIAVQQSANLQTFTPLSLTSGVTTFNAAGALEFRFNSSTGAQFYRLQSK